MGVGPVPVCGGRCVLRCWPLQNALNAVARGLEAAPESLRLRLPERV